MWETCPITMQWPSGWDIRDLPDYHAMAKRVSYERLARLPCNGQAGELRMTCAKVTPSKNGACLLRICQDLSGLSKPGSEGNNYIVKVFFCSNTWIQYHDGLSLHIAWSGPVLCSDKKLTTQELFNEFLKIRLISIFWSPTW